MAKKTKKIIILCVVAAAIIAGILLLSLNSNAAGKLDGFAQCLKDKGAVFYGAFWCPHCQTQKTMFGKSEKLLPYVECSTPDGNGQLEICRQNKIEGYPTWKFTDGTEETGEVSLIALAEKTGCVLPK